MRLNVVVAAMLACATAADAQDVEGTVLIPNKPPPKTPKKYPGDKAGERLRGPAIVFIDGVAGDFKPEATPKIEQKDRQFTPLALPVVVGTTVAFPNLDDEYHNVFSRSTAKEFDLGRYDTNESRAVIFDKPGVVRLRCEVHSHMHAVIVVLENPFFAVTDANGAFAIRKVPPGKYKIYAFHEDYEPKDRKVDPLRAVGRDIEVKSEGKVTVDFNLRD
jgi:plastocyanin